MSKILLQCQNPMNNTRSRLHFQINKFASDKGKNS